MKMIKRLERLKILLINIWPTYDLPVRTEVGRKSTTWCILVLAYWVKQIGIAFNNSINQGLVLNTVSKFRKVCFSSHGLCRK
jgi:hypothetical protein